jgi:hypothetical protein
MTALGTQLILGGTLFLSNANPAFIKHPATDVWFSDPQAVSVQTLSQGLLLRAKDSTTGHQALGIDSQKPGALVRLQNVSDASYQALKRCPQAPLDAGRNGLRLADISVARALSLLGDCGFEGLRLSPEQQSDALVAQGFALKESEAMAKGYRILSTSWEDGLRVIVIDEAQRAQITHLKQLFADLASFIEFRLRKAPRPGNTLIFEVTLFEFFRNAASKIGVSWPSSFRILDLEGSPFRKLNPTLALGLDFGESQGVSRVLARPQIRVKAGEKARFQSGGEIPVQIVTDTVRSTQWKEYGLILELAVAAETPTGADEISLDFKVEVSEPDFSRGTEVVPGLAVRRLESRFDVRTRETTVLTTLLQMRSGALRAGLAGLSRIPVAKELFSSRSRQEQESELWFAIRPHWDEIPWNEETLRR